MGDGQFWWTFNIQWQPLYQALKELLDFSFGSTTIQSDCLKYQLL